MKGYRDSSLFGDGVTDPYEVCYYETQVLGNDDIAEYMAEHPKRLNTEQIDYLWKICCGDVDEVDKEYFNEILKEYIGDRNFCLWLCKEKEQVYNCYAAMDYPDKEDYLNDCVEEYSIPKDAIRLSELDDFGALWCWKNAA